MERNRDNIVYDIDKDIKKRTTNPKLQLHNVSGSSGNNITQTVENVNFPINYDMQNQQNNTQDFKVPIQEDIRQMEISDIKLPTRKTLNPTEISSLIEEDENTTPILPNAKVSTGKGESNFGNNIENKNNMLNENSKSTILSVCFSILLI